MHCTVYLHTWIGGKWFDSDTIPDDCSVSHIDGLKTQRHKQITEMALFVVSDMLLLMIHFSKSTLTARMELLTSMSSTKRLMVSPSQPSIATKVKSMLIMLC